MYKIKPVLPSLREKKRYIKCDVISEDKLDFNTVKKEVDTHLLKFLGENGYSKAGIQYVNHDSKLIVRTSARELINTISALMLMNKIRNKNIRLKTTKVSGILKKLKKEGN